METVALDSITLAYYNPRRLRKEQAAALRESLEKFGPVDPIIVNRRNMRVVGGHSRVAVALQLGWTELPVAWVDLDDQQERELNVRLNANTGEWDLQKLVGEFDQALLAGWGLAAETLRTLTPLALAAKKLGEPDDVPELAGPPNTRPGDLWALGRHRLLCGDALVAADYERLLCGQKADMVFTDPPYGINYEGKTKQRMKIKNDNLGKKFQDFLNEAFKNIFKNVAGAVYIASPNLFIDKFVSSYCASGGHLSNILIWVKDSFSVGRADYQNQFEAIIYGWPQGSAHYWCGARTESSVWPFKRPKKSELHPTVKPVELVERAIQNSSKPGALVLDPFAGSGTTAIACERLDRAARLIELDPRYCDVIVARWEQFTGQRAELLK